MLNTVTQNASPRFNSINESREVKIEIITPVHVGAASEKLLRKGTDYFFVNNHLYFVDFNKLLKAVLAKGVEMDVVSTHLANGRVEELQTYLFKTLKIDLNSISYDVIENFNYEPGTEIRPLIKTGAGKPYITGSSIKGAVRSVLFNYLFEKVENINAKSGKELENLLLGKFNESIMRYIRVYDAGFDNLDTGVNFVHLFNLYNEKTSWESDWKRGFNITAQVFQVEAASSFRLSLAHPLAEIIGKLYKKADTLPRHLSAVFTDNPFEHLHQMINYYTRRHIEKELEFFKKYDQLQEATYIIENLENLLAFTHDKESCLLRMAYGSGFHGITGDWRFENHFETINKPDEDNWVYSQTDKRMVPARYKSRRIVNDNLMGFVKLTF